MPEPNMQSQKPQPFRRLCTYLLPLVIEQRRAAVVAMVALFASTALSLLEPWPLKIVLDDVLDISNNQGSSWWSQFDTTHILVASCVAVVLFALSRAWAEYHSSVSFAIVGNRALSRLRNQLYRHLHLLSPIYHGKSRQGDLVVRVIGDVNRLRDVASTALFPVLANVLLFSSMLVVMLILNWRLTLIAISVLPVYGLSTVRLSKKIHAAAGKQRKREGALAATASESINAINDVQALSLHDMFDKDFHAQNHKSLKEGVTTSRLSAKLERTVDVVTAIATALVLGFGASMVLKSETTIGELVVFITYLKRCFRPAKDFAKHTGRLAKAAAAGERVVDLLEQRPDVCESKQAIVAPRFVGELEFQSVNFGYRDDRTVLSNITLSIPAGQRVALIGESGCGKSTLLRLIIRMFDPQSGTIRIDGHDVRDFQLESLRSQISILLQDCTLFAASVWDNIAFGAMGADRQSIEQAARLAGADEFIRRLPNGYDTILGERGMTLSRGQRQRLAIARAAIRNAPILLLDEPLTGLDPENSALITEALDRLSIGKTTILVTHEWDHAVRADRVLRVSDGTIAPSAHSEFVTVAAMDDEQLKVGN